MHFTLFIHLFALQRELSIGNKTKLLRPRLKLQDQDQIPFMSEWEIPFMSEWVCKIKV